MASMHCPHCGAPVPRQRTWAEVAVSTLVAAPAVPDMATPRRCDRCGRVFAAGELRHETAGRFHPRRLLPWLVALALLGWVLVASGAL